MQELGFRLIGIPDIIKGKNGIQLQVDGLFENTRLI
jgi:hypothetical protein